MNFFEVLYKRHSCRQFNPNRKISDDLINKIIEAGKAAPSAGGIHPVGFTVVKDKKKKQALAEAAHGQSFIVDAPVNLIIWSDIDKTGLRYGKRGRELYVIQDSAAAAENILLAATALDLGSCWVGAFDEDEVRKIVGLQKNQRPFTIIPLGYPKGKLITTKKIARAIVLDKGQQVAILNIKKRNHYRLPGGAVEIGKSLEETLKKELREETGCRVKIIGEMDVQKFFWKPNNKIYELHYFLAKAISAKRSPNFNEWEKENKYTLIWLPLLEAIKKFQKAQPKDAYDFESCKKDLGFLLQAQEVIKSKFS